MTTNSPLQNLLVVGTGTMGGGIAQVAAAAGTMVFLSLWTNTSMISITEIARPMQNPGRLVGVHFFNPVPRMAFVELMDLVGLDTIQDCLKSQAAGMKRPVDCGTDLPRLVAEGSLGKKSGQGFYNYTT